MSSAGYDYRLFFRFTGGAIGMIGLAADDTGPVAGMRMFENVAGGPPAKPAITISFRCPLRLYSVLFHRLSEGVWGG